MQGRHFDCDGGDARITELGYLLAENSRGGIIETDVYAPADGSGGKLVLHYDGILSKVRKVAPDGKVAPLSFDEATAIWSVFSDYLGHDYDCCSLNDMRCVQVSNDEKRETYRCDGGITTYKLVIDRENRSISAKVSQDRASNLPCGIRVGLLSAACGRIREIASASR